MAEHGGYRKPSQPAAVSGPGALSQRTDGGPTMDLPNAKYGEAKDFAEIQSGAPMPGRQQAQGAPSGGGQGAASLMSLLAPTQNPDQPVTAGANAGPGPDASGIGLPSQETEAQDLRRRYGPLVPLLIRKAAEPRSSQQFRDQVRYLLSVIL